MKKKLLAVLAALLLCVLAIPVLAAEKPTMTVTPGANANPGSTLTVTVSISQVEGCTSVGLGLQYDTAVFEMEEDSFTMLVEGTKQYSFKYLAQAGGYVAQIQMDGAQSLSGDLFSFRLKVKDSVAIGTATTITGTPSLRLNNAPADCELEDASLTVSCLHSFGSWTKADGSDHQRSCVHCGKTEKAAHGWDGGRVTAEATCTAEGTVTYGCADCGATKTEAIDKKEHSWDGGTTTLEPTCDIQGEVTYTCTVCGTTRTETLGKLDHVYDDGRVTKEATCTEDGVMTFSCTDCTDSYTKAIPATGHDYNDGDITRQPACAAEGVKTFTCRTCWETYTEAIPAKGHTPCEPWQENIVKPTCDTDGGYDMVVGCTVCLAELSREHFTQEALGHIPGEEWVDNWVDQGCETEGSYETVVTCTRCGEDLSREKHIIEPDGHDYDGGQITTPPTCIAEGIKTYTCSVCGGTRESPVATGDHTYDNSCDTDCNVCGAVREIEHNYSERLTFDTSGHWHACEVCGEILEPLPHKPGPEATDTEDQICLECGFVISPAGSHEHEAVGDWLSDADNHWHQCACAEKLEQSPHTWNQGQINEEAGEIRYVCTVCGYPRTELWQKPTEPAPTEPQPTEPKPTEPKPTSPESTGPKPTAPTEPPHPGTNPPGEDDPGFPWWIALVVAGIVTLGVTGYIIIGILVSRKKTGRFSK